MDFLRKKASRWLKKKRRQFALRCRRINWQNRNLPDFVILGAHKAGTTSLYFYLRQHPQLTTSIKKEVHFFDGGLNPAIDNYQKGEAWYRAHFPIRQMSNPRQKVFEASPLYLFNPLVPLRMSTLMPDAKLIVLLRNPRERAISHYFHGTRKDREPLPILEAFQREEERLQCVIENEDYKNLAFRWYSYKRRGVYHEQIKRYLEHFSFHNLLALSSERFFANPAATLKQVYEFVGVDPAYTVQDLQPRNTGGNKIEIEPAVYEYLDAYFHPHNRALYELLGHNYGW